MAKDFVSKKQKTLNSQPNHHGPSANAHRNAPTSPFTNNDAGYRGAKSSIEMQDVMATKQLKFPFANKKRSHAELTGNANALSALPVDWTPVPLQAFLWQQTLPFIRPCNRAQQEDAATTFEKVLVQNIHYGASPQLSESLHVLPRWRIVLAALPHVILCCSAYLENRDAHGVRDPFDQVASKLFYTLHWILNDAASECFESQSSSTAELSADERHLLLPVAIVQNFVYLMAPLTGQLADKDFTSYRLESGLKIWKPMWQFRAPQVRAFLRPIQTSATSFLTHSESWLKPGGHMASGDIYLGFEDNDEIPMPRMKAAEVSQNCLTKSDNAVQPTIAKTSSNFVISTPKALVNNTDTTVGTSSGMTTPVAAGYSNSGKNIAFVAKTDSKSVMSPETYVSAQNKSWAYRIETAPVAQISDAAASSASTALHSPTPLSKPFVHSQNSKNENFSPTEMMESVCERCGSKIVFDSTTESLLSDRKVRCKCGSYLLKPRLATAFDANKGVLNPTPATEKLFSVPQRGFFSTSQLMSKQGTEPQQQHLQQTLASNNGLLKHQNQPKQASYNGNAPSKQQTIAPETKKKRPKKGKRLPNKTVALISPAGSAVSSTSQKTKARHRAESLAATVYDVAMLKNLFTPNWSEEGIYAGLRYLHNRLQEIRLFKTSSDAIDNSMVLKRSHSMPAHFSSYPDPWLTWRHSHPGAHLPAGRNKEPHRFLKNDLPEVATKWSPVMDRSASASSHDRETKHYRSHSSRHSSNSPVENIFEGDLTNNHNHKIVESALSVDDTHAPELDPSHQTSLARLITAHNPTVVGHSNFFNLAVDIAMRSSPGGDHLLPQGGTATTSTPTLHLNASTPQRALRTTSAALSKRQTSPNLIPANAGPRIWVTSDVAGHTSTDPNEKFSAKRLEQLISKNQILNPHSATETNNSSLARQWALGPLQRSRSDSSISYFLSESPIDSKAAMVSSSSVAAIKNLVDSNSGELNYLSCARAVLHVLSRMQHPSQRVCAICVELCYALTYLIHSRCKLAWKTDSNHQSYRQLQKQRDNLNHPPWANTENSFSCGSAAAHQQCLIMHRTLLTIIMKIFSRIGCVYGCGKGALNADHYRLPQTKSLRSSMIPEKNSEARQENEQLFIRAHDVYRWLRSNSVNNLKSDKCVMSATIYHQLPPNLRHPSRAVNERRLQRPNNSNTQLSARFMRFAVQRWPLGDLISFMHCFYGSCQPANSQQHQRKNTNDAIEEETVAEDKEKHELGDARKFSFVKANQTWLTKTCLTTFLGRLVHDEKRLDSSEMFGVYGDARCIINYLREAQANTFKRQLLTLVSSCWKSDVEMAKRYERYIKRYRTACHSPRSRTSFKKTDDLDESQQRFFSSGDEFAQRKASVRSGASRKRSQLSRYSSGNNRWVTPSEDQIDVKAMDSVMDENRGSTKNHLLKQESRIADELIARKNLKQDKHYTFDKLVKIPTTDEDLNNLSRSPVSPYARGIPLSTIESEAILDSMETTKIHGSPHNSLYNNSDAGHLTPPGIRRANTRDSVFSTPGNAHHHGRKSALYSQPNTKPLAKLPASRRKSRMSFKMAGQIASMSFLRSGRKQQPSLQSLRETLANSPLMLDAFASGRRKSFLPHNALVNRLAEDDRFSLLSSRRISLANAVSRFGNTKLIQSTRRLSLMLNACHPGILPEASVLGVVLDMAAPPIAKALFLTECCNFVHQCNIGKWPEWVLQSSGMHQQSMPMIAPHVLRNTSSAFLPSASVAIVPAAATLNAYGSGFQSVGKITILHKTAGKFFYEWALSLNVKLRQLLDEENDPQLNSVIEQISKNICAKTAPHQLVQSSDTNAEGQTAAAEPASDAWFIASQTNPYEIRFVIAQLLFEITTFMRDLYGQVAAKRTANSKTSNFGAVSGADSRGKNMGRNRRWSVYQAQGGSSQKQAYEAFLSNQDLYPQHGGRSSNVESRRLSLSRQSITNEALNDDSLTSSRRTSSASVVADANSERLAQLLAKGRPAGSDADRKGILVNKSKIAGADDAHTMDVPTINSPAGTGAGKNQHRTGRKRSLRFRRTSQGHQTNAVAGHAMTIKIADADAENVNEPNFSGEIHLGVKRLDSELETSIQRPATSTLSEDIIKDKKRVFHQQQQHFAELGINLPWLDTCTLMYSRLIYICPHLQKCVDKCFVKCQIACWRLNHVLRKVYGELPETWLDTSFLCEEHDDVDLLSNATAQFLDAGENAQAALTAVSTIDAAGLLQPPHDKLLHNVQRMLQRKRRTPSIPAPHNVPPLSLSNAFSQGSLVQQDQHGGDDGPPNDSGLSVHESSGRQEPAFNVYPVKRVLKSEVAKYLYFQVRSLFAAPLATLVKGCLTMSEVQLVSLFPVAWEFLLLQQDEETVCNGAVFCIVSCIKCSGFTSEFIRDHFRDQSSDVRLNSVLRFAQLWKMRYHVWLRLEVGAQALVKLTPPNIDYTLPSPMVGRQMPDLPDAPWQPQQITKLEEVAISTEEQEKSASSFVSATSTRRKKLQESMKEVLRAEQEKHQRERENLRVFALPAAKLSCQETASSSAIISMASGNERDQPMDSDEIDKSVYQMIHSQNLQPAMQFVFPPSLCSCVPNLIEMLDDSETNLDGTEVGDVARSVIWDCILDDPSLFFRHFFENLSNTKNRALWIHALHKLLSYAPVLPAKAAYTLFNYLLGFVMFHIRSPGQASSREAISSVLSVLWQIVPSVDCMLFKDLKATLRREQCEAQILVTSSMTPAKKVVVHGPDLTAVPAQFPITEETQFGELLHEALEFFDIPPNETHLYHLLDVKTRKIMHHPNGFVKDVYAFRSRTHYPQLILVRMSPSEAFCRYQIQAYFTSFVDTSRVLLIHGIVKSAAKSILTQMRQQQQMLIIQDELGRLPSFPRKAIEIDMRLVQRGQLSEETHSMDLAYKYCWLKLIARLFACLEKSGNELQMSSSDAQIFLDVVNGALLLHAEDPVILRFCLVTYINVARQIKHVFLHNGYMLIMPSILSVYARLEYNELVQEAIEFAFALLFLLHRSPFLLQTLSSAALLLEQDQHSRVVSGFSAQLQNNFQEPKNFQPQHLVKLITSLTRLPATYESLKAKNKALVMRTRHHHIHPPQSTSATTSAKIPPQPTAGLDTDVPDPQDVNSLIPAGDVHSSSNTRAVLQESLPAAYMREKARRGLRSQPVDLHLNDVVHLVDNICEGNASIPSDFLDFSGISSDVIGEASTYTREAILMSAISASIAVIASDEADSVRGHQMLTVLNVLMREAHAYIILRTTGDGSTSKVSISTKDAKEQLMRIQSYATCIRSLIYRSTDLARNYTGTSASSNRPAAGSSPAHLPSVNVKEAADVTVVGGVEASGVFDDETTTMLHQFPDGGKFSVKRSKIRNMPFARTQNVSDAANDVVGADTRILAENADPLEMGESVVSVADYCLPRSNLLALVADFYVASSVAIKRLSRILPDVQQQNLSTPGAKHSTSSPATGSHTTLSPILSELNDTKTINKLTDIAHTILKVATVDIDAIYSEGLLKFVVEMLPELDFASSEAMKAVLTTFLRRFEKTFNKIVKKPQLRRELNWAVLAQLLRGLGRILGRNPSVCHSATVKNMVQWCILLVVGSTETHHGFKYGTLQNLKTEFPVSSLTFSFVTQELLAVVLQATSGFWTLESACSISDKPYRLLVHILLPLCLHFGKQGSYLPPMLIKDMHFYVRLVTSILVPAAGISNTIGLTVPPTTAAGQLNVPSVFNMQRLSSSIMASTASQVVPPIGKARSPSIMSAGAETAASISSIAGFYTRGGASAITNEITQHTDSGGSPAGPSLAFFDSVASPKQQQRGSLSAYQNLSAREVQQRVNELGDRVAYFGLKCLALSFHHRLVTEYPRILRSLKSKLSHASAVTSPLLWDYLAFRLPKASDSLVLRRNEPGVEIVLEMLAVVRSRLYDEDESQWLDRSYMANYELLRQQLEDLSEEMTLLAHTISLQAAGLSLTDSSSRSPSFVQEEHSHSSMTATQAAVGMSNANAIRSRIDSSVSVSGPALTTLAEKQGPASTRISTTGAAEIGRRQFVSESPDTRDKHLNKTDSKEFSPKQKLIASENYSEGRDVLPSSSVPTRVEILGLSRQISSPTQMEAFESSASTSEGVSHRLKTASFRVPAAETIKLSSKRIRKTTPDYSKPINGDTNLAGSNTTQLGIGGNLMPLDIRAVPPTPILPTPGAMRRTEFANDTTANSSNLQTYPGVMKPPNLRSTFFSNSTVDTAARNQPVNAAHAIQSSSSVQEGKSSRPLAMSAKTAVKPTPIGASSSYNPIQFYHPNSKRTSAATVVPNSMTTKYPALRTIYNEEDEQLLEKDVEESSANPVEELVHIV